MYEKGLLRSGSPFSFTDRRIKKDCNHGAENATRENESEPVH
jgi:hypothetical protein